VSTSLDELADVPAVPAVRTGTAGGPWRTALGQLLRNRAAVVSAVVVVVVVPACVGAPLYASHVAHTDPFRSDLSATTEIGGRRVDVIEASTVGLGLGSTPIGPTWDPAHYALGADGQGRDVAARLLYGGRNSLFIGFVSAVLCCVVAAVVGIVAGYFGGVVDAVLSRLLEVVWAFPVYLLGISLSIVLIGSGITLGPVHVDSGSIWLPVLIIAAIFVPYVARPVRGQVLSLRERDFVRAAVGLGASDARIMRRDVLPNVLPTVVVFLPLMTAVNMLTESALSFLSIGVQPPDASWGTIINDGLGLLYTRPAVAVAPGLALVVTAVALNVLGDGVRDALDPQARLRGAG
jgi:peptide/nickel transport system permease protein